MGFKRYATASWNGDLKTGKGAISTPQSGLFSEQNFSFNTRFGEEKGTNPEELLAAAHAGCFSMALCFMLQNAGYTGMSVQTRAEVSMESNPGPTVVGVHLIVKASVPEVNSEQFRQIADSAKANCVISRALGVPITMEATLV